MAAPAHILVAEDEALIADILQMSLEEEGYRVTVAPDGIAAALAIGQGVGGNEAYVVCLPERPQRAIVHVGQGAAFGFDAVRSDGQHGPTRFAGAVGCLSVNPCDGQGGRR